jgi:hypothetical protein
MKTMTANRHKCHDCFLPVSCWLPTHLAAGAITRSHYRINIYIFTLRVVAFISVSHRFHRNVDSYNFITPYTSCWNKTKTLVFSHTTSNADRQDTEKKFEKKLIFNEVSYYFEFQSTAKRIPHVKPLTISISFQRLAFVNQYFFFSLFLSFLLPKINSWLTCPSTFENKNKNYLINVFIYSLISSYNYFILKFWLIHQHEDYQHHTFHFYFILFCPHSRFQLWICKEIKKKLQLLLTLLLVVIYDLNLDFFRV